MSSPASVIDLAQVVGPACVRDGTVQDRIDDVAPAVVVEPTTPEGVAAALQWCSRERRRVVVRGGGTKLSWGRPPDSLDVVVSMRGLRQILRYEPGDLTVTVEAGATIADLNAELARHRQWLPLDGRSGAATIGGTIATNESGPLRHRYGAPRDVLIGVKIATADGRLASAGGNVVKNVAGYDLGRLMAGSFGSLAVIVSAAFKLSPVPATAATVAASFATRDAIAGAAADVAASQLDPLALEVHAHVNAVGPRYRLFVRHAGMAAPVVAQTAATRRLLAGWSPTALEEVGGDDDQAAWREASDVLWAGEAAIVRVSWLPAELAQVLAAADEILETGVEAVELCGRAALGAGYLRLEGPDAALERAILAIRAKSAVLGNAVVVRAPLGIRRTLDVWGVGDGTALVGRMLKTALDPAGVLNAGRGPI